MRVHEASTATGRAAAAVYAGEYAFSVMEAARLLRTEAKPRGWNTRRGYTHPPMVERFRRHLPAWPHPHFMGLAPLDVWVRMLARGGAWRRVKPRYWVRLGWCLFTSGLGTVLTLPERGLVWVWLRGRVGGESRARRAMADRTSSPPGPLPAGEGTGTPDDLRVLCVLGYYRSGTTHLHYVLSCDPGNVTPRWYQALAPQGWVVSWAFLRWLLVPFLGSTRPQDDVAIGPEWPAEDDFALCNWTLSSPMPGRMVLPREWERADGQGPEANRPWVGWKSMHDLCAAPAAERRRWAHAVWAFAWKVSRAAGGTGHRVILKTPSHTARVRELLDVFGPERVKFIHITREPGAVLRSNVAMHRRFGPYLLQDAVGDDEVRRRIVEEYDATERKFLDECGLIPAGSLARMRYQDLVADPMGELRRAYAELGLAWSAELEARFARYLKSVADYRAASGKGGAKASREAEPPPAPLAWMIERFGHDRPAKQRVEVGPAAEGDGRRDSRGGARPPSSQPAASTVLLDTLMIALVWGAAWIGLSWMMRDRLDWLTWPTGVIMGVAALRLARTGSARLGVWAAMLTLAVLGVVAYPATCLAFYRERSPMPWGDVWDSTRDGLLAINNLVWLFLGLMTAYRMASRKDARAPGA